ncbi:MAG: VOC family protein [Brachymonas sp.]|nr:VOC family protein [Brachymonas sp.]
MTTATPFLMFHGTAEAAMHLYQVTLPGSRIVSIERHGPSFGEHSEKVRLAKFEVCGQTFLCSDSTIAHNFTFTPSSSIFVDCDTPQEQERIFSALAEGGVVLMPLDDYGFSQRFGWLNDRFGVSWQINLPYAREVPGS